MPSCQNESEADFRRRTRIGSLPAYDVPNEKRRKNMSAIRSKNTRPEMRVRKALHAAGFRYRLHCKELAGCPDVVLPKYQIVVFVHGCFWHGHDCPKGHRPRSNSVYWNAKIARNVARDISNVSILQNAGWSVHMLRECTLAGDLDHLLAFLVEQRAKLAGENHDHSSTSFH